MKVVHIESGLGNQMLSFGEYLVLKKLHPDEDIYIETITYDIPETSEVINQWNGYELERIFGIHVPNVKDLFTPEQWAQVLKEVRDSDYWDKNWNYPVYITRALNHAGLELKNIRGDFESPLSGVHNVNMKVTPKLTFKGRFIDTPVGNLLRRYRRYMKRNALIRFYAHHDQIFYRGDENIFTGQWLGLKMRNSGIELVADEIRQSFRFPDFTGEQNRAMAALLSSSQSVAIHARRGDMLGNNGYCYKYGYFRRAVKYIRRRVDHPLFVFFTDPGSVEWCRSNPEIFGLDFDRDKVLFVDWNKAEHSYRDMQLIACCKHAIITNSSFGWWGAYFITNPGKITISPMEEIAISTTHHC
ncbi:alpha-1,2-fucosyltransferase [Sodaliphilus pleomorphus]|uniref:alpha-1,2-fucosyltransferase n=1 Tax=Sodaliphilus pleomorphus TaxID=2606626 RepID=UPI002409AB6A|nr:alpha-1,2-fucosyltransferase [Sodaliphilus pleomorphus]MDD6687924.1 alpha-1,2-fucosyltransferase [Sodaliphilus pleomorphus]